MRVAHLLAPPSTLGGAEQVVLLGAAAQQAAHHAVTLISLTATPGLDDAFCDAAAARGLEVVRVATTSVFDREARRTLQALSTARDFDVLHVHGGRALGLAHQIRGVPVVAMLHGLITTTLRSRVMARAERWLAARSDAAIVVSRQLEDRLRRDGVDGERLFRVENPVRLMPPPRAPTTAPAGQQGPLRLLMLARLSREKGVDVAIRAVARVGNARLDIAGDGPERARLQGLIERLGVGDRVRLCGVTDDVGAALRAADALVLSSRSEGQPLALLEALASGVPVVATDVGDVAAVLGTSHAGILVQSEDVRGLADGITHLGTTLVNYRAAARAHAPVVVARHAPATWARAVDTVYRAAITRFAPHRHSLPSTKVAA